MIDNAWKCLNCKKIIDISKSFCSNSCRENYHRKSWANMSEMHRSQDRKAAPEQSKELDEYYGIEEEQTSCSCHINPPCSVCINRSNDNYLDEHKSKIKKLLEKLPNLCISRFNKIYGSIGDLCLENIDDAYKKVLNTIKNLKEQSDENLQDL